MSDTSEVCLIFSLEPVTARLIEEIKPLLERHYEELGRYKELQLEPDFDSYLIAQEQKTVRVYTVRENTVLIGYTIFFVTHSLHHKNTQQALQDILWLDPKYRRQSIGADFLFWCEGRLRDEGVQIVLQVARNRATQGAILEATGYEILEWVYSKRL